MKNKNEFLNITKAGFEPVAKDEIFVQVHNTHNYWVSNYGRVVNNLKGKDNFYMYKTGNVHLTLTNHYVGGERVPKDTYIKDLVVEHFLFKQKGKDSIYFVDGNKENNYYKNLVCLDSKEAYAVRTGIVSIDKYLDRQEYIDYLYKGNQKAKIAYNMMYKRTHDEETKKYYPEYADIPKFAYHQFAGAHLVQEMFGIKDPDIIEAIELKKPLLAERGLGWTVVSILC